MNIETANRLLHYRKAHQLSQEDLAGKIGVSRQAVSKWERAEASPDTDNLIALAGLYGVTLDDLLKPELQDPEDNSESEEGNGGWESPEWSGVDPVYSDKRKRHVKRGHGGRVIMNGIAGSYVLIVVIVFFLWSFVFDGTSVAWLVFLTIPVFYSLLECVKKRNPTLLAYPLIPTIVYLYVGIIHSVWHPTWLVFLTIPIYYVFTSSFNNRVKEAEDQ